MSKKTIFKFIILMAFTVVGGNLGSANIHKPDGLLEKILAEEKANYYKSTLKSSKDLLVDSIITYTKTFVGTPFKWGGESTDGFDCSGLFHYVFDKFDLKIPRTSRHQVQMGEQVSLSEVQKGDFLFFKGRNLKNEQVKHVSFAIGRKNGSIIMIHSTHRGIVIDRLEDIKYYKERFIVARRLNIYDENEDVIIRATRLYGGFMR